VSDYDNRIVALDSNALTYFLDGNRGTYRLSPDDPIADQRVAAVRLFLYCKTVIVPTVTAEALRIGDEEKRQEHLSFINNQFAEFVPDGRQMESIERRTKELLPHHRNGENDCRILAEVEEDGDIPVLATWDKGFRTDLARHTRIRLESPVACWDNFKIPRGTPSHWTPYGDHLTQNPETATQETRV
jgi:hypothetical protein